MDLEIIGEEIGVGIADDHRSVCGEGHMGKRDAWLRMYSGESGSHQCPPRHWKDTICNAIAGAGDFSSGVMTEYMTDMEKGYWGDGKEGKAQDLKH